MQDTGPGFSRNEWDERAGGEINAWQAVDMKSRPVNLCEVTLQSARYNTVSHLPFLAGRSRVRSRE